MPDRTIGDLIKAKDITADCIDAAVDAYLMGIRGEFFALAEGVEVNLGAAVEASVWAKGTLANLEATEAMKRNAVKTAILLAPVKAK